MIERSMSPTKSSLASVGGCSSNISASNSRDITRGDSHHSICIDDGSHQLENDTQERSYHQQQQQQDSRQPHKQSRSPTGGNESIRGLEIQINLNDVHDVNTENNNDGINDGINTEAAMVINRTHSNRRRTQRRSDSAGDDCLDMPTTDAAPWPPRTSEQWRDLAMAQERRLEEDQDEQKQRLERHNKLLAGETIATSHHEAATSETDSNGDKRERHNHRPRSGSVTPQASPALSATAGSLSPMSPTRSRKVDQITELLLNSPKSHGSASATNKGDKAATSVSHKLGKQRLAMFGGGNTNNVANAGPKPRSQPPQSSLSHLPFISESARSPSTSSRKTSTEQPQTANSHAKLPNGFHKRQSMRNVTTNADRSLPQQPKRTRSNSHTFSTYANKPNSTVNPTSLGSSGDGVRPASQATRRTEPNNNNNRQRRNPNLPLQQVCFRHFSASRLDPGADHHAAEADATDANSDSDSDSFQILSHCDVSSLGEDRSFGDASSTGACAQHLRMHNGNDDRRNGVNHNKSSSRRRNGPSLDHHRAGTSSSSSPFDKSDRSKRHNQEDKHSRNRQHQRTNYRFRYEGPTVLTSSSDEDGGLILSPLSTEFSKANAKHGKGRSHDNRFAAGGAQEKVPPAPVQRKMHVEDYAPGLPGRTSSSSNLMQPQTGGVHNVSSSSIHSSTSSQSMFRRPDVWVTPIQNHHQQQQKKHRQEVKAKRTPQTKRQTSPSPRSGLEQQPSLTSLNSYSGMRTKGSFAEEGDDIIDDGHDDDERIDNTYDRFASTTSSRRRARMLANPSNNSSATDSARHKSLIASSQHTARSGISKSSKPQRSVASSALNSSLHTALDSANGQYHDPCASPPQLPQLRQPPKRRWRIKRVWNVEELDDLEEEYTAENPEELYTNLRNLFGIPGFPGAEDGDANCDDFHHADGADHGGMPELDNDDDSMSTIKPWKVLKLLDINGELIDNPNEKERKMDEKELIHHLSRMAVEDLLYVDAINDEQIKLALSAALSAEMGQGHHGSAGGAIDAAAKDGRAQRNVSDNFGGKGDRRRGRDKNGHSGGPGRSGSGTNTGTHPAVGATSSGGVNMDKNQDATSSYRDHGNGANSTAPNAIYDSGEDAGDHAPRRGDSIESQATPGGKAAPATSVGIGAAVKYGGHDHEVRCQSRSPTDVSSQPRIHRHTSAPNTSTYTKYRNHDRSVVSDADDCSCETDTPEDKPKSFSSVSLQLSNAEDSAGHDDMQGSGMIDDADGVLNRSWRVRQMMTMFQGENSTSHSGRSRNSNVVGAGGSLARPSQQKGTNQQQIDANPPKRPGQTHSHGYNHSQPQPPSKPSYRRSGIPAIGMVGDDSRFGSPIANKHKKRAFRRPDNWVSPDERPIIGKRSWKFKKELSSKEISDDVDFAYTKSSSKKVAGSARAETRTKSKAPIGDPLGSPNKHKQRAFHRPDNWVSPNGKPNMYKRSWVAKKIINVDGEDEDKDNDRSAAAGAGAREKTRSKTSIEMEVDKMHDSNISLTMDSIRRTAENVDAAGDQNGSRHFDSPIASTKHSRADDKSQAHTSKYGKSPFPSTPVASPQQHLRKASKNSALTSSVPYLSPLDGSSDSLIQASMPNMASSGELLQDSVGDLSTQTNSSSAGGKKKGKKSKKIFTPCVKYGKEGMPIPKPKVAIKMWWE